MFKALSKTSTNLIADGLLITTGLTCVTAWYAGDSVLADPVLWGIGLASVAGLVRNGWIPWRPWQPKRHTLAYSTNQAMRLRPSRKQCDPDIRSWRATWKEGPPPDEFSFESGAGKFQLPVEVAESEMLRFLQKAYRRQMRARYKDHNFIKIYSNAIMSKKEFVPKPFFENVFHACKSILALCGLIADGSMGNGKSGQLWGEYTPTRYLEIAKWKWTNFLSPAPRRYIPLSLFW